MTSLRDSILTQLQAPLCPDCAGSTERSSRPLWRVPERGWGWGRGATAGEEGAEEGGVEGRRQIGEFFGAGVCIFLPLSLSLTRCAVC